MRLWLRLTLLMAALTLVPLGVTGVMAVRATAENATLRPEEAMARHATGLSTFVGSWVHMQAEILAGWSGVWDLSRQADDYRINLLRATWKAMDDAVTVALVDGAGRPVVPAQYLTPGQLVPDGRQVGSAARAEALLARAPVRLGGSGFAIGQPYVPPGSDVPVVPIAVPVRDSGLRVLAEVTLAPVLEVLDDRPDAAAVLVDGDGVTVFGADHPLLGATELDEVLRLAAGGQAITFSAEADARGTLQGALSGVPHTDWKLVVLAPPDVSALAAETIKGQTVRMAALAFLVVLTAGFSIERTLTRSVEHLREHATAVTRGRYGERNLVDRGDEIGDLGLALNLMSARLETTEAELRAFHEELQARVDARSRQLEAAQAQLVRAGQLAAIAELGAGLAHELNNPLAVILGQVQLAQAQQGPASPEVLAHIEREAQRCRDVVDTMVRLSAGEVDAPGGDVVDLSVVLGEAILAVRPQFERRRVALEVRIPDDRLSTTVQPAVAQRVLTRLLESVCAGLSEGARLTVEARPGPAVVLLPDREVGAEGARDDWRSAGLRFWTARGLLELSGGRVEELDVERGWAAVFPEAA